MSNTRIVRLYTQDADQLVQEAAELGVTVAEMHAIQTRRLQNLEPIEGGKAVPSEPTQPAPQTVLKPMPKLTHSQDDVLGAMLKHIYSQGREEGKREAQLEHHDQRLDTLEQITKASITAQVDHLRKHEAYEEEQSDTLDAGQTLQFLLDSLPLEERERTRQHLSQELLTLADKARDTDEFDDEDEQANLEPIPQALIQAQGEARGTA